MRDSSYLWQQAEAAAQKALSPEPSASKLDAGQLQRLKQRNHELMQRKAEAAAAKQQQEETRLARLQAMQDQVCLAFGLRSVVSACLANVLCEGISVGWPACCDSKAMVRILSFVLWRMTRNSGM